MKKAALYTAFALSCALMAVAQVQPKPPGSGQITGVSGNGHTLATVVGPLTAGDGVVPDGFGNLIDSGSPSSGGSATLNSVAFCNGFTPTNGQVVQYTTASSPNPCWTAATVSGGGGMFGSLLSATPTMANTGLTTAYNHPGTFAATNVATGIEFQDTAGTGFVMEGQIMAYPGTAFTATILLTAPTPFTSGSGLGFVVANSPTTQAMLFGEYWGIGGQWSFYGSSFTTPNTGQSQVFDSATGYLQSSPFVWLRFKDDGTSIYYSYSYDGIIFTQIYTATKSSSFLGSSGFNYLGYALFPGAPVGNVLESWTITTP